MPFGVPPDGSLAIVYVGTTATPTTPLGGLNNWKDSEPSPTTTRDYYMQPSIISSGKRAKTITLNVDYEEGDSGQQIVFTARANKTSVFIKIAPGGVNGETTETSVSQQDVTGPDANGFSTIDWTLGQKNAPVAAGAGYGG